MRRSFAKFFFVIMGIWLRDALKPLGTIVTLASRTVVYHWLWWWLPLTLVHVRQGMREGSIWTNLRDEEGNADYGGMVQPSQQHVAPCVKVVGCLRIWHERLENVKLPGKFNHASLFLLSLLYFHLSNFSGSFCCICVYICLLSSLLYVFVIFAQLFQISIIQTNWVKS